MVTEKLKYTLVNETKWCEEFKCLGPVFKKDPYYGDEDIVLIRDARLYN